MKYLHTMVRVADPDASVRFFNLLGLSETRRIVSETGRYTLIFMAADEDVGSNPRTATAEVELTYNWPNDDDASAESYSGGRNFGHLAYRVNDIYSTCQRLMLPTTTAQLASGQTLRIASWRFCVA